MTVFRLMAVVIATGQLIVNIQAQSQFSLSVTPTRTVADGVSGEETRIAWDFPDGTITLLDLINFYKLTTSGYVLVATKQEILRGRDSQYAFKSPGTYAVTYDHFGFLTYTRVARVDVSVAPVSSLIPIAANFPPRGKKIIAFGDSLIQGVGATTSNLVDWVSANTGLNIINAGVSGNTTGDGLNRVQRDVIAMRPDVVVVLLSPNDFLNGIPKATTFSNLRAIVSQCQNAGAVVVVLGFYAGALADQYRDGFHELYTTTRSILIPDILDGIVSNPFLTSGDHFHPNDEGYRRMALRIAPIISTIVSSVSTNGLPPTNSVPPLPLSISLKFNTNQVTLKWFAVSGAIYEVLFSPDIGLPVSEWAVIQTVAGTGSFVWITVTRNTPSGFYTTRRR